MQFTTAIFAAIFAAAAAANSITFNNLDGMAKTIYFTGNENMGGVPLQLKVPGHGTAVWRTQTPWVGNFFSINDGEPVIPGLLGEVNFADKDLVWYDASAIVNAHDNAGVKKLWSSIKSDPVSGCDSYSSRCNNAYNLPNDIQTKSTTARDLFCSVGLAGAAKREESSVRAHARDFMNKIRHAVAA